MSLAIDEGESEQSEIKNLQEKLESTTRLVYTLSQQLTDLKEQVGLADQTLFAPRCLHPMPPNLLSCNLTSLFFLLPLNLVLPLRRPPPDLPSFLSDPLYLSGFLISFLFHCSPHCLPASFLSLSPTFQPYLPFRLPPSILPTSSSPTSPFFFFFPTTPPPSPIQPCLASFSLPSSPICLPVASP